MDASSPRLTSRIGHVYIWRGVYRDLERLYVSFGARRYADFLIVKTSFQAAFPAHGQACYNARAHHWSLPGLAYRRLLEWAESYYTPDAIHLDERPPQPAGQRPPRPSARAGAPALPTRPR